jgi:hypothetical protein
MAKVKLSHESFYRLSYSNWLRLLIYFDLGLRLTSAFRVPDAVLRFRPVNSYRLRGLRISQNSEREPSPSRSLPALERTCLTVGDMNPTRSFRAQALDEKRRAHGSLRLRRQSRKFFIQREISTATARRNWDALIYIEYGPSSTFNSVVCKNADGCLSRPCRRMLNFQFSQGTEGVR